MAKYYDYIKKLREDNARLQAELNEANAKVNEQEELLDASMDSLEGLGVDLSENEES